MIKGKRRTAATITLMSIFAVIILCTYFYWTNRTEPFGSSKKNLTEVQKLVNKDFKAYYPGTPREVVRQFADMIKALYNNPKDADSKALALKIRELYDQEFLDANPEDNYISSINADLAHWADKNRKITNYLMQHEDQEEESEIDGVKYATEEVEFTMQEHSKFSEVWNVLLRQDEKGQWKILGWEPLSGEDEGKQGK